MGVRPGHWRKDTHMTQGGWLTRSTYSTLITIIVIRQNIWDRTYNVDKTNIPPESPVGVRFYSRTRLQGDNEREHSSGKPYPNITAFQSIILLSWGAPLIPAGGSCCRRLKSRISLFLDGVDMISELPPLQSPNQSTNRSPPRYSSSSSRFSSRRYSIPTFAPNSKPYTKPSPSPSPPPSPSLCSSSSSSYNKQPRLSKKVSLPASPPPPPPPLAPPRALAEVSKAVLDRSASSTAPRRWRRRRSALTTKLIRPITKLMTVLLLLLLLCCSSCCPPPPPLPSLPPGRRRRREGTGPPSVALVALVLAFSTFPALSSVRRPSLQSSVHFTEALTEPHGLRLYLSLLLHFRPPSYLSRLRWALDNCNASGK